MPPKKSTTYSSTRSSSPRRTPKRSTKSTRYTPSGWKAIPKGVRNALMGLIIVCVGLCVVMVMTARPSTDNQRVTTAPGGISAEALMEVKNPKGLRHELVRYTGMNVSFNRDTHQPNWVAWELLGEETSGAYGREPGFNVDDNVKGCATPADYRHSGFDRGHMAPAGDMKWHPQAMRESFYMTNISPQAQDLNRGAWKKLEEKCRQRAQADSALIIICGPVFDKSGPAARIGGTGVAVPQQFFKVILAPYGEHPRAIGFLMPNSYVEGGMQKTAVSVDRIEQLTGYDFFSALPDDVEDDIEARCDFNEFSHVRRR